MYNYRRAYGGIEEKKTENCSAWEQKLPPCNFQASYAREFTDWIAIKRDASNQVMEVTCNWYCCFDQETSRCIIKICLGL